MFIVYRDSGDNSDKMRRDYVNCSNAAPYCTSNSARDAAWLYVHHFSTLDNPCAAIVESEDGTIIYRVYKDSDGIIRY